MKIDVIVLTKNSDYMLDRCLHSIYQNTPIDHLIIVDAFSIDRTLEILDRYSRKYRNVVLVQEVGTRGTARQKGIELVDTEWFAFVDSDVILKKGWFETVKRHIADDVGAVEGNPYAIMPSDIHPKFPKEHIQFREAMTRLRGNVIGSPARPRMAFTGDTLIRKEAVKDIVIPPLLRRFEDKYIKAHVVRKGYKWIHLDEEICDHYSVAEKNPVVLELGASDRIVGFSALTSLVLNVAKSFPKGVYTAFVFKNARAITYPFKYDWEYLVGWLQWKKVLT